ncbi:MAG: tail fiber domain-containing protein [Chitinophagales bacterium]|nr:tail fiber domain-containing protein [Chitinophagales bacterium]
MKNLLIFTCTCIMLLVLPLNSIGQSNKTKGNSANAQNNGNKNGVCNNIQQCNDKNFSATEDDDLNAGEFYNSMNDNAVNVVHSEYTGGPNFARAYFGKSAPAEGVGIGARFEAGFCAIEAFTLNNGANLSPQLFGTFTAAIGGGLNTVSFGVVGGAGGMDSTVNIGVYGFTHDLGGAGALNYSGFFEGDVFIGGTMINPSDKKLKQNTQELDKSLSKLNKLSAKSYTYKTEEYSYMNLPKGEQYGFIAQELEEVFPQLVSKNILPATDERRTELPQHGAVEFKGINYVGMIPIIVEAINEQSAIIEEKDLRITELEDQLDQLLVRVKAIESVMSLDGSGDTDKPFMKQNQPNPSNGSTSIEYYLPENTGTAFLKVYNTSGKEIHSFMLNGIGYNKIDVNMRDQATATYFYSLFIDGIAVDTKQMVINRLD